MSDFIVKSPVDLNELMRVDFTFDKLKTCIEYMLKEQQTHTIAIKQMQDRSDTFATIREMKTLQDAMSKNLVQLSDNLNEFEDEITTKTDL